MTHDHHHHSHQQRDTHHRVLDLDAEVFGDSLAAVLDLVRAPDAHTIVDLGAGTGAGSRLLRQRYPDATVTCVDNDPQMLQRLRQQGFAVVEADLNQGFPASIAPSETPVDLVWASSSLHHVTRPTPLLSGARRTLAPAGVLVVVELATLPSFLADSAEAMLEQRCHAAAAAAGWNHYPDWTPIIEAAGFTVTRSEVTTTAPVTPAAREYAQQWFARFAHLDGLSAADRTAVQDLLPGFAGALALQPRTTRTVWAGKPDHG